MSEHYRSLLLSCYLLDEMYTEIEELTEIFGDEEDKRNINESRKELKNIINKINKEVNSWKMKN